jgi:hypothetical protein
LLQLLRLLPREHRNLGVGRPARRHRSRFAADALVDAVGVEGQSIAARVW